MAPTVSTRVKIVLTVLSLALVQGSCGDSSSRQPVVLSYFRLGWARPDELAKAEPLLQEFTRETNIRLRNFALPESTLDQLDLSRKLLESSSGPDVLSVDVIWPGVLAGDLMDLRPDLASEISLLAPRLISSYTVGDKLVAIPYFSVVGILQYRADLLRKYGYKHPPTNWDELERMAIRIQAGERSKGKKDFWGYVWQGAEAEALTCNALEWQAAQGGGRLIEGDGTVSVNNPAAIRSWERAKHWIGWISPPSVLNYRETDSMNAFDSGRAAFNRVWGETYIVPGVQFRLLDRGGSRRDSGIGFTSMPGGPGGRAGILGGAGMGVSRRSAHPQEAMALLRYWVRLQIESNQRVQMAVPNTTTQPEFYDLPLLWDSPKPNKSDTRKGTIVSRPSNETGDKYEAVSRAYINAVHSVLTGDSSAAEAASKLEKQLVKITGFRTSAKDK